MANSDLLGRLKAERGKHGPMDWLCRCGLWEPCPLSRALDCAIALAVANVKARDIADKSSGRYGDDVIGEMDEALLAAMNAAAAAWEKR